MPQRKEAPSTPSNADQKRLCMNKAETQQVRPAKSQIHHGFVPKYDDKKRAHGQ